MLLLASVGVAEVTEFTSCRKLSNTRFLRGGWVAWANHIAEVEYGAHIWTVRRLRVFLSFVDGGSWNIEFWEFYPTFSKIPSWISLWKCEHFACDLFCFPKVPLWKSRKSQKMCRKTKSRAYQLHFGTILSSKLSIGFENGSIEVHEHDLVTAQDWYYGKTRHLDDTKHFVFWASTRSLSRTSFEPFSKPIGSLLLRMIPKWSW